MILSNRHKVRGRRTQARRVARWRAANLTPDWGHLNASGVDYLKLWLDPWNRLPRREPPAWLRRQMLVGLLDILNAWHAQTCDREDLPYLAVWLCWPHFMDSQVVLAREDRAPMYDTMFEPIPTRPLPNALAPLAGRLNRLHWTTGLDETPLNPEDFARWPSLARRPHRTVSTPDGPLHLMRRGLVWIGRPA
ncbi:hypothetical protein [Deinococcus daejeonensis]|uniref:Uncharacterized protein n=1 Tax=Deinococcus daejeonensis TaxID=1007098 RepID=A0ABQ2JG73_9DEIO|nr:hypothetical protein [Deinococcus daejeonensis]GGN46940.1 hypothetical protein GCM10010842_37960 [Deinococcus daejeonensis]